MSIENQLTSRFLLVAVVVQQLPGTSAQPQTAIGGCLKTYIGCVFDVL